MSVAEPMTRAERRAPRTSQAVAMRRCCVSGAQAERTVLLRLVATPEGVLVPDLAATLPGRGLWVKPDATLVTRGVQNGIFRRALAAAQRGTTQDAAIPAAAPVVVPVVVPEIFVEAVRTALRRRVLEHIGLARRAGVACLGESGIRGALADETPLAALLQAHDSTPKARARIDTLVRAINPACLRITCFAAGELEAAAGRAPLVELALAVSPLARRIEQDLIRLGGFEPLAPEIVSLQEANRG